MCICLFSFLYIFHSVQEPEPGAGPFYKEPVPVKTPKREPKPVKVILKNGSQEPEAEEKRNRIPITEFCH